APPVAAPGPAPAAAPAGALAAPPPADWARAAGDRIRAAATPRNRALVMISLHLPPDPVNRQARRLVAARLAARAALGPRPARLAERADLDPGRWPRPGAGLAARGGLAAGGLG